MLRKADALATTASAASHTGSIALPLGHRVTRRRRQLFYTALFVALVSGLAVSLAFGNSTWFSLPPLNSFSFTGTRLTAVDVRRWHSTCDVPLFVAVLNDARYVEDIALAVRQHNERFAVVPYSQGGPDSRNELDCRRIVLHILDNTGCSRHHEAFTSPKESEASRVSRNVHRRSRLYESQVEHLYIPPDTATHERIVGGADNSVQGYCRWWNNVTEELLAGRRWSNPTGGGKRTPDVVLTRPLDGAASLTFGQSMNWMLSESAARYDLSWFLWMHTDAAILDFTVLNELLGVAADLEFVMREPFSYVLTQYDSLCVIHAAELRRRVGFYDPFLWYYGEVELMLRAELAGVPMVQWPTSGSRVFHEGKSSMQQTGRQAAVARETNRLKYRPVEAPRDASGSITDDGYRQIEVPEERRLALLASGLATDAKENTASIHPRASLHVGADRNPASTTRFQRMTDIKLALWKAYYEAKWESEFQFPNVSNTTIAVGRVVLHPCTVPSMRFGSVRALVDSLGRALQSPTSLTIRGINLRRGGDTVHNGSCGGLPPGLRTELVDVEQFDFYFLPADAFQRWVDSVEQRWHGTSNGASAAPQASAERALDGAGPLDEFEAAATQRGAHKWFGILRMDFFETLFDKK